jgi:hypothetical protein
MHLSPQLITLGPHFNTCYHLITMAIEATTLRVAKGLAEYVGEGPKWRLGQFLLSVHPTCRITNLLQNTRLVDRLPVNKLHASVDRSKLPRASCVSAHTRCSSRRDDGTWRGVIGESTIVVSSVGYLLLRANSTAGDVLQSSRS